MAPEIFIKAYARATTEEYQMSEGAPKIDAKNPAGNEYWVSCRVKSILKSCILTVSQES